MLERKLDQAGQMVDIQFVHDLAAIRVDRLAGQRQPLGDLDRYLAVRQQPQNLAFALVQSNTQVRTTSI